MDEQWYDIPGYEGFYQLSNLKRVKRMKASRSTYTGKILQPTSSNSVTLYKNGKSETVTIRALVRKTFGVPHSAALEGEVWRDVVDYKVSNLGRVMRATAGSGTHVGRILKPFSNGRYLMVQLCRNMKYENVFVHILVLGAFVGPCPERYECHHKNGDRMDNRVENLEWVTHSEHMRLTAEAEIRSVVILAT